MPVSAPIVYVKREEMKGAGLGEISPTDKDFAAYRKLLRETVEQVRKIDVDQYKYGFETDIESVKAPKGLDEDTVRRLATEDYRQGRWVRRTFWTAGAAVLAYLLYNTL